MDSTPQSNQGNLEIEPAKKKKLDELTRVDWKVRFDAALDARKLELGFFWQRSLFFGGFITVAAAGFMAAKNGAHEFTSLVACCFGLVCAFVWALANRGSKYWYENWELKVKEAEPYVVGPLFAVKLDKPLLRGGVWSSGRFSVSKLAIALSDFVCAVWLFACIAQVVTLFKYGCCWGCTSMIVVVGTILYLVYIWLHVRHEPLLPTPKPVTTAYDTQVTT